MLGVRGEVRELDLVLAGSLQLELLFHGWVLSRGSLFCLVCACVLLLYLF